MGGILTVLCGLGTLGYLVNELGRMTNQDYDNYNSQLKSNPLTDGFDIQYLNQTSFLPVVELVNYDLAPDMSNLKNEFDIFDNGTSNINFTKL